MSIKFDAAAAEKLIEQMDQYCSSIQREATEMLDILEFSGEWDDSQHRIFLNCIEDVSRDLIKSLKLQSNYMQIFSERVAELRG